MNHWIFSIRPMFADENRSWYGGWPALMDVAARTALIYVVLLVGLRLTGRRQIGQLTPFDLVVLLLLSNSVQNAMTGPDTTVAGGVMAAFVLLVINLLVARLRLSSMTFRKWVEGVPIPLVLQGRIQAQNLRHEQITEEELLANLRQHEVTCVENCEMAMLEIDGTISVIRRDPKHPEILVHSRKKLMQHHKRSS